MTPPTIEHQRLIAHGQQKANWKHWGPYLSERAWGTVREDYSEHGTAWDYFPHDHARSRAYRWNEDGLAGISDRHQYLCFALALWNGRDPILKERLFGLTGPEGNHGEDVKEYYFYLDSTPTHSYMKMLYKYPQREFPYGELVAENGQRSTQDLEYELLDTGVFVDGHYFDVLIEYAKASENDILIQIRVTNHGQETANLTLLPTLWFRNTWSWGYEKGPMKDVPGKPIIQQISETAVQADHPALGTYYLYTVEPTEFLFTENETNRERLYGLSNATAYVKDAFHRYIIAGENETVNPAQQGTKVAGHYLLSVQASATRTISLRLTAAVNPSPFHDFDHIYRRRQAEADDFYRSLQRDGLSEDEKQVQRQAFAGMLWSKQLYYYDVEQWLTGDPAGPPPARSRQHGRNDRWQSLNNFDVISMPDKWEYPWYAAWDLAFHCLPLALLDPDFAKQQLILMTREWYMHPNGQFPAYEWALGDVNPPVHAWAALQVYQIDAERSGEPDFAFLKGVFNKLLLNFTWWVNRKDENGNNIFQGGFLGLDNISIFDRSAMLPIEGHIDQSDGTAWMGFYCLSMLRIALELAKDDPIYEDMATKFYEHFLSIAVAMSGIFRQGHGLWDDEDGFFYDVLHMPDDSIIPLKVRSLVGLIPLIAVEVISDEYLQKCPDFTQRMYWFSEHKPHLSLKMAMYRPEEEEVRHMFAILTPERLRSVLRYLLDEDEFLSPYGVRSLSKVHQQRPFGMAFAGAAFDIDYQPAESRSGLFGGNSNWRGPVWLPINYLIIEALRKLHYYYGANFQVECPVGSGNNMTLDEVADELARRLVRIFLRNESGERPVYGGTNEFQADPKWRDYLLFYEYFHGENGTGLGASHQTGWTGLVANLIQQIGGNTNA